MFAIHPLKHVAEGVTSAAMPGVKSVGEMTTSEKLRVYQEAVRFAWRDGVLDKSERQLLEHLRAQLGIRHDEASRIEVRATRQGVS